MSHHAFAHLGSLHAAYAAFAPHGNIAGKIIGSIISGAAHSIGWHVVASLIRGAGFLHGLLIAVIVAIVLIAARLTLRRMGIV